jgi:MoaA/NifB/PqqE/SkfB family radical SAM enzyme
MVYPHLVGAAFVRRTRGVSEHSGSMAQCRTVWKVCVRPNGDVRPCCSMEITGNLRTHPIGDILRSEPYIGSIERALLKDCPGCSCRYTLHLDVSSMSWLRELVLRVKRIEQK